MYESMHLLLLASLRVLRRHACKLDDSAIHARELLKTAFSLLIPCYVLAKEAVDVQVFGGDVCDRPLPERSLPTCSEFCLIGGDVLFSLKRLCLKIIYVLISWYRSAMQLFGGDE